MERIFKIIILCGLIFLLSVGTDSGSDLAASVNGDVIYKSEIELAVEELKDYGNVTYSTVLDNSIDELLVVQMADQYNVTFSDEDFSIMISNYKNNFPQFYQHGVTSYGEKNYLYGLYRRQLFLLVKQHVQDNVLDKQTITDTELLSYLSTYSIDSSALSAEEILVVKNRLIEQKKSEAFTEWMKELREFSDVIIYH